MKKKEKEEEGKEKKGKLPLASHDNIECHTEGIWYPAPSTDSQTADKGNSWNRHSDDHA